MSKKISEKALTEQRPVLYRYALIQLKDSAVADDAVQETLLAALQNKTGFSGKSSLRTWLIGILKHKIADYCRKQDLEPISFELVVGPSTNLEEESETDFFNDNGSWNGGPATCTWADPEASMKQDEFWSIYETCQKALPANMANVFMLRELVGLETDEVCQETGISEANYWTTMHRARLRLRECLEIKWFNT